MDITPLAYHAWFRFLAFIDDDQVVYDLFPDLAQTARTADQLDHLEHVSDWLHLWLLSGQPADYDWETYLSVVLLTVMRFEDFKNYRHNVQAAVPSESDASSEGIVMDGVNNRLPIPQIPLALTREMFDLCRTVGAGTSAAHFLDNPAFYRWRWE